VISEERFFKKLLKILLLVSPDHGPSDAGNDHLLTLQALGQDCGRVELPRYGGHLGLRLSFKVGSLSGAGLPLNDQ